jgi:hypothetical protein
MEKWYFLEGSIVYSGLTKLASKLVDYTKHRYEYRIVNEWSINLVVRQIELEADRLHAANPRCKKPVVKFVDHGDWDYSAQIYIDDWFMNCKKAKGVIQ